MAPETPFPGDPDDSREAIMRATYCALKQYGYAGLSIQRIADEADLSKSTFYHHYDDKHDLLTSFVDFILAEFTRVFSLEAGDGPEANLRTFVRLILDPTTAEKVSEESPASTVLGTYVELRAQAVQDETIREKFTEVDRSFEDQIAEIVENGVASGVFRDVDPEQTATFVSTLVAGQTFRQSTRDDDPSEAVLAAFDDYVRESLLRDDA
ncbi:MULTISPECIES: TetR/AcrR family transcriptional regulator [Halomicrobium]|uniref:Transcriptional regulator, TetR family n=2 Tax=Halomicrobium mukohataei TaxID=57705 RepID=C7P3V8_HALMD|nr:MULTISPECIES: TetR/AcrR family transcriptional regulator [Halomicrobium]ACV47780.1 transcriptional regulator, TetR family [Halomicrobium mukohataei DSM 12286]QCD66229.1 TetR/AcrR family transcriptional regulator [Halomicrobium mukohataei]QFR21035.1 TetR family transcriptional regulator [Halomicrobium sp. ZPS1]